MNTLANKVALVTGAASGFGYGIARSFIDAGARVGVLDIDAKGAEAAADKLGPNALAIQANVADRTSLAAAVTALQNWTSSDADPGRVDILVNNAGVGLTPTPLEAVVDEDFQRVFDVNMRAIYIASQIVVPVMKAQGGGCILNIASTAGVSPRPGLTWYNASKGWVITATRSMAVELAPDNIRVNALNPVAGDTPLLKTFMGEDTPQVREKFLSTIPLGRFSTPEDIGNAALFLCSDAAAMITGVAMEVDGGRCI